MNTFLNLGPLLGYLRAHVRDFFSGRAARKDIEAYLSQADSLPQLEYMERQLARRPGSFGSLVM